MATEPLRTNRARLVRTRLAAAIVPTLVNQAVAADGRFAVLPGQGGVIRGIRLGDLALSHLGDHVEPGLSLGHAEPAANRAVQILSSIGNPVDVVSGPARGARGMVYGKHGHVLAAIPPDALARVAPGDQVVIESCGVGLCLTDRPEISCLSLSPQFADQWLGGLDADGRLLVPVICQLPPEAAAAGIGMPSQRFNMDLHSDQPTMIEVCKSLCFGDLLAVQGQDHRFARSYRKDWLAVGVISHGRTIAGGHGLGFTTLLTGPVDCFRLVFSIEANAARVMGLWGQL